MPTPPLNDRDKAYFAESSAWEMLEGHIPGQPGHDPSLWAIWIAALKKAIMMSESPPTPPTK
jgi:hypothetical protein